MHIVHTSFVLFQPENDLKILLTAHTYIGMWSKQQNIMSSLCSVYTREVMFHTHRTELLKKD